MHGGRKGRGPGLDACYACKEYGHGVMACPHASEEQKARLAPKKRGRGYHPYPPQQWPVQRQPQQWAMPQGQWMMPQQGWVMPQNMPPLHQQKYEYGGGGGDRHIHIHLG